MTTTDISIGKIAVKSYGEGAEARVYAKSRDANPYCHQTFWREIRD